MKTLLCLLSIFCALPVAAQNPVQEIPELQEWYSLTLSGEGSGISYLPDFDTENGGKNAIAIRASTDQTWYNRFAYDTVNQFSWSYQGAYMIAQADLNGDGIKDYVDSRGFVYKGSTKNHPPDKNPVAQPLEHLNARTTFVGDFNGDGYEDILTGVKTLLSDGGNDIFILLFGDNDLTKLQSTIVSEKINNNECLIGAYVTSDGKSRVITYHLDSNRWEGFMLYSLDITGGQTGGTFLVDLSTLDNFGHYLKNNEKPLYNEKSSGLYQSIKYNEHTLLASMSTGKTSIYSIVGDKFQYIYVIDRLQDEVVALRGSIDGDDHEDWVRPGPEILFYSSNPAQDTIPKSKFTGSRDGKYITKLISIGDVSGDGIGDVALMYQRFYFVIARGKSPTLINEIGASTFTTHSTEPNPIGKERNAILPAIIERAGSYTLTLYDGSGKLVAEIFKGELLAGEARIPFNLKPYNLSAGFYNLRLTDGKHTLERGIMLTNQ